MSWLWSFFHPSICPVIHLVQLKVFCDSPSSSCRSHPFSLFFIFSKVNDDWLGYPHYSSHILNFSTTKFQLDLRFNHPQDLTTMFHEIDVAQLQIAAVVAKEEEEEDPSSICGGCKRRRRGESGMVSNSPCNNNDNNNLGIPTAATVGRVRAGAGTRVDGSGSHEFNLQWLTLQQ